MSSVNCAGPASIFVYGGAISALAWPRSPPMPPSLSCWASCWASSISTRSSLRSFTLSPPGSLPSFLLPCRKNFSFAAGCRILSSGGSVRRGGCSLPPPCLAFHTSTSVRRVSIGAMCYWQPGRHFLRACLASAAPHGRRGCHPRLRGHDLVSLAAVRMIAVITDADPHMMV
jgi:hypothetical protein